ncbi:hypothetical protein CONPUDRAFT_169199 [Coniophora puteana RWD-64-598 SS2]|uniref:Uncharacterized protein n=1 Tax=Coniophora puteana (strain RWD-64-598) TaxID=741705 RepID=A0A5M3MAZ3_CONPW|nr:uncharacterized protein CONPUDRAFT_169199 [Coniophora puteana RWD-64-598 SS2]EIW75970.1 hypothetical protein CONPUDRAFT_169199 [Coniophora puteana RWD-64-598 SS2]
MTSLVPSTDLWLERSRLDGMIIGAVSYGIFVILSYQAGRQVLRRPRFGAVRPQNRKRIFVYIVTTFVLATIGFAGNVKYTEMIWIDLRDTPGGPSALIINELQYWVNLMALACYYVMEWFMEALLLWRCFIVWNYSKPIIAIMTTLFLTMVAMSIWVLAQSSGVVFYNANGQLAYLVIQVGITVIYTVLVAGRIFAMRKRVATLLGWESTRLYDTLVLMIVESAALYSVVGIIFIFSFAFHSNVSNLVFLDISHVQGIAQLLIIIRVMEGRSLAEDSWDAGKRATSLHFRNTDGFDQAQTLQLPELTRTEQSGETDKLPSTSTSHIRPASEVSTGCSKVPASRLVDPHGA